MPSDHSRITVRFMDVATKIKLRRIARNNGRSTSREVEQVILHYIDDYEKEHGKIHVGK